MALEIEQHEREGVRIVELSGRLNVGQPVSLLRETITGLVASGVDKIVLDLKGVDYIDSTGLGGLVLCYTTTQKSKGSVKLCRLNRRNLELLVLTKLTAVFDIFNDEQDAVNSFFPNREIKRFDILSFVQQQQQEG
jgi:anti-sigma B factor antagonist